MLSGKIFFGLYLFSLILNTASAQSMWTDSTKRALQAQKEDSSKVYNLLSLSDYLSLENPDSALIYALTALKLAETLHFETGIFWANAACSNILMILGNYPLELEHIFNTYSQAKKLNTPRTLAVANAMMSGYYYALGEYRTSLSYWIEVQRINERWFPEEMWGIWANLSFIYSGLEMPDSAMLFARKAFAVINVNHNLNKQDYESIKETCATFTILGNGFTAKKEYDSAAYYYGRSILISMNNNLSINTIVSYNGIAKLYKLKGMPDSAIWYAEKVLNAKIVKSYPVSLMEAANLLSEIYELKKKPDSTLKYVRVSNAFRDSLFNREKMLAIRDVTYREQEKNQEIIQSKTKLHNRYKIYGLMTAFIILLLTITLFFKNNRKKQLQRIRNSIADDLHDDIGSTLSSIGIMSSLALANPSESLKTLAAIGECSYRMQGKLGDIVWAVNPKNDSFENIFRRMNEFAFEITEAKSIELEFSCDVKNSLKLSMEQRKNLYLFFKEVINNSVKHSFASLIHVKICEKSHYIELSIVDNGKGFDTSTTPSGNGMETLKKRAEELNADFRVKSANGQGTEIHLSFKIS